MNLKFLAPVTQVMGRALLTVQKHSPELLTVAGIVGGVTASVLACKSTLTLHDDLEPLKNDVVYIRNQNNPSRGKDLTRAYSRMGLRVARHYAIPIGLGLLSAGAILAGFGIIHRRNAALIAAYNSLELAYNTYREKVREEFGDEKDQELLLKTEKQLARSKKISKDGIDTGYIPAGTARFFDKYNPNFNAANKEMNLYFLKLQQTYLNDLLRVRGFVTLNEVYEKLGMEPSRDGLMLGWVTGRGRENFIDFGIWNANNESARDFVNGREDAILLQFNHHGILFDLMEGR